MSPLASSQVTFADEDVDEDRGDGDAPVPALPLPASAPLDAKARRAPDPRGAARRRLPRSRAAVQPAGPAGIGAPCPLVTDRVANRKSPLELPECSYSICQLRCLGSAVPGSGTLLQTSYTPASYLVGCHRRSLVAGAARRRDAAT